MATLKVSVDIELNGQRVEGYPLVRRLEVDETQQFDKAYTASAGYVTIPSSLGTIQALVIRTNKTTTLRLDAQSDAGIEIAAGGFVVVMDATINADVTTNALVSNTDSADAQIEGIVGGTYHGGRDT